LEQFRQRANRNEPDDADIDDFYEGFKSQLYPSAKKSEEIPCAKEAAVRLGEASIPLVMTTGYDRKTVDLIRDKFGWIDEVLVGSVTNDDVRKGRPAPYLIWHAMEMAGVSDIRRVLKVGDTEVDVEASDNTYMPGAIVLTGSIADAERARQANERLGRNHLVVPSLIQIIDQTLDGTIVDRFRELNK
jgi:phosphoglycolate phosphatase-like HAD superfamily hydrolase